MRSKYELRVAVIHRCRYEEQLAALQARQGGSEARPRTKGLDMAEVNKKNTLKNFNNALKNVGSRPDVRGFLRSDRARPTCYLLH